jgi:hypothetical protein
MERRMPAGPQLEHPHREMLRPVLFGNKPPYFDVLGPLDFDRTLADVAAFFDLHCFILLRLIRISAELPG